MISFLKNLFSSTQTDFAALLEQGALVIDVRSPHEFAGGHADGSVNIPLGEISNHIREIKQQNKPVITCCRSGARSGSAAATFQQAGIDAYNGGTWNNVQAIIKG